MKNMTSNSAACVAKVATGTIFFLQTGMVFAGPTNNVPEPGPIGLLLLGGVALFVANRFRKNK